MDEEAHGGGQGTIVPVPVLTGERTVRQVVPANLRTAAESSELTVSYSLNPDDIRAFDIFIAGKQRSPIKNMVLITGAVAIGAATAILPDIRHGEHIDAKILWDIFLALGLPLLVFFLVIFFVHRYFSSDSRLVKEKPEMFRPQVMSLAPEFLSQQSDAGESKTRWRTIKQVTQDEKHIFFSFANDTGVVVPKNAFAAPPDADAFFLAAEGYWRGAKAQA